VSPDVLAEANEKQKANRFKNKSDMVKHLLLFLKTPQELVQDDLERLREHLLLLDGGEAYEEVERILRPYMEDQKLIKLYEAYGRVSESGRVSDREFRGMCNIAGIKSHEMQKYHGKLMEYMKELE
jgi:hypothetical protein